jgi:hypothetical protein
MVMAATVVCLVAGFIGLGFAVLCLNEAWHDRKIARARQAEAHIRNLADHFVRDHLLQVVEALAMVVIAVALLQLPLPARGDTLRVVARLVLALVALSLLGRSWLGIHGLRMLIQRRRSRRLEMEDQKGGSMTRSVIAGLAVVSAVGCVSTHMKQFIGKDAIEIEIHDGPPARVFDLPDGRRAFQYFWGGGSIPVPASTQVDGEVRLLGGTAYYREQRLSTPPGVIETEGCRITYLARWQPARQGWIVEQIVYPKRAVC